MAKAERMSDEIFPAGRHFLHLDCVEEGFIKSQFPTLPDGTSKVFYWRFTSRTKDQFGVGLTLRHMTDARITPNNKTTKFWKQMMPVNAEGKPTTFDDIDGDTEPLESMWYVAQIVHETKGDKTYANIAFIEPYVPKAKGAAESEEPAAKPLASKRPQAPSVVPAPVEAEDDEDFDPATDPFKDE